MSASAARAQLLIVGNDEKITLDGDGKQVRHPPGKDTVSILDIHDRAKPKIVANLPMMNSLIGPPVNLAITHDQRLALVANSLDWQQDGDKWKDVPDNKVFLIDLISKAAEAGRHGRGRQAAFGHGDQCRGNAGADRRPRRRHRQRADDRRDECENGRHGLGGRKPGDKPAPAKPAAVAITPDGKHALVTLPNVNQVALLDIDGSKVTRTQIGGKDYAMTTGLHPLNVQITPDGKLGLVGNMNGGQDGQIDNVAVIDLTQNPPRDRPGRDRRRPEGLAIDPAGGYAASLILNGTGGAAKGSFVRHEHGYVQLLKITGKEVRRAGTAEVGGLPEGIAFSPDGRYLYVGNFVDGTVDILHLAGDSCTRSESLTGAGPPPAFDARQHAVI